MDADRSVLHRKLAPRLPAGGFAPDLPPPAEPAPDRHLSRALIRALSRSVGLVAHATLRARRVAPMAELAELLEPEGFVALLSQPDGPPGLIALDARALTALVEAMTTATLAARQPPPRRPTPTDAALLSEVIDALMTERAAEGEQAAFRFDRMVRDLRLLDILVEDCSYDLDLVDFELTGAGTARPGLLLLALPQPALPEMPDFCTPDLCAGAPFPSLADAPDEAWQAALEGAVLGAPAELRAVLGRVTMPLAEAMTLGVGSTLLLPLSQLEEVEVEAIDRRPVGRARLGQYRGMRAVRLTGLCGGGGTGGGQGGNTGAGLSAPEPARDPPALDPPASEAG